MKVVKMGYSNLQYPRIPEKRTSILTVIVVPN